MSRSPKKQSRNESQSSPMAFNSFQPGNIPNTAVVDVTTRYNEETHETETSQVISRGVVSLSPPTQLSMTGLSPMDNHSPQMNLAMTPEIVRHAKQNLCERFGDVASDDDTRDNNGSEEGHGGDDNSQMSFECSLQLSNNFDTPDFLNKLTTVPIFQVEPMPRAASPDVVEAMSASRGLTSPQKLNLSKISDESERKTNNANSIDDNTQIIFQDCSSNVTGLTPATTTATVDDYQGDNDTGVNSIAAPVADADDPEEEDFVPTYAKADTGVSESFYAKTERFKEEELHETQSRLKETQEQLAYLQRQVQRERDVQHTKPSPNHKKDVLSTPQYVTPNSSGRSHRKPPKSQTTRGVNFEKLVRKTPVILSTGEKRPFIPTIKNRHPSTVSPQKRRHTHDAQQQKRQYINGRGGVSPFPKPSNDNQSLLSSNNGRREDHDSEQHQQQRRKISNNTNSAKRKVKTVRKEVYTTSRGPQGTRDNLTISSFVSECDQTLCETELEQYTTAHEEKEEIVIERIPQRHSHESKKKDKRTTDGRNGDTDMPTNREMLLEFNNLIEQSIDICKKGRKTCVCKRRNSDHFNDMCTQFIHFQQRVSDFIQQCSTNVTETPQPTPIHQSPTFATPNPRRYDPFHSDITNMSADVLIDDSPSFDYGMGTPYSQPQPKESAAEIRKLRVQLSERKAETRNLHKLVQSYTHTLAVIQRDRDHLETAHQTLKEEVRRIRANFEQTTNQWRQVADEQNQLLRRSHSDTAELFRSSLQRNLEPRPENSHSRNVGKSKTRNVLRKVPNSSSRRRPSSNKY